MSTVHPPVLSPPASAGAWDGLVAAVVRRARLQPGERALVVAPAAGDLLTALPGSLRGGEDDGCMAEVVVAVDALGRSRDPVRSFARLAGRCLPGGRLVLVETVAAAASGALAAMLRSTLNVQAIERLGEGSLLLGVRTEPRLPPDPHPG